MNQQEKLLSRILIIIEGLFLLNVLFCAYVIGYHLNIQQVDLAGHMASAVAVLRGYYHKFNPSIFLGYVHGLFYPPLEDFILAGIFKFTSISPLSKALFGFKIYLIALWTLYCAVIYFFIRGFKSTQVKIYLLSAFLILIHVDKPELLYFQGMSFQDLWQTGLSSQILGGIFFFLLLYLIREKSNSFIKIFIVISGLILSHLVVALAGAFFLIVYFVCLIANKDQNRIKTLFFASLSSLCLCSFFWLPFLRYRNYMSSAHLSSTSLNVLALFSLLFLLQYFLKYFVAQKRDLLDEPVVIASCLLCLLVFSEAWLRKWGVPTPVLHYYRFEIYVLVGLVISSGIFLEKYFSNRAQLVLPLFLLIFIVYQFPMMHYFFSEARLTPTRLGDLESDPARVARALNGRTLTLEPERTVDFSIDSLLWINNENYRSVKGLYWESTKTNNLLSTYLASILSPPVVLDYFYLHDFSCRQRMCILDHFAWDFGIKNLIAPRAGVLPYLTKESQSCWAQILSEKQTIFHNLKATESFNFNGKIYDVYKLEEKEHTETKMTFKQPTSPEWYYDILMSRSAACESLERDSSLWSQDPIDRAPINIELQSKIPKAYRPRKTLIEGFNFTANP
jgi:hypothetical protein